MDGLEDVAVDGGGNRVGDTSRARDCVGLDVVVKLHLDCLICGGGRGWVYAVTSNECYWIGCIVASRVGHVGQ